MGTRAAWQPRVAESDSAAEVREVASPTRNSRRHRPAERERALAAVSAELIGPLGKVEINRQRIVLAAREEIILLCGESSITLRRDGKVIIKGRELVSRAKGTNKIKGAAVKIN